MAGTNTPLRLTQACGYGDPGTILTPNGVVREWLLAHGLAVVHAAGPEIEARPAVMAKKAAEKIRHAARRVFA